MNDQGTQEVGFVKNIRNFLVHLDGMPTVKTNEIVENEAGVRGWISGLLPDRVEMLLLDEGIVQPGQLFKRSDKRLEVTIGQFLLGRTINPLGTPIDGKGPLGNTTTDQNLPLNNEAPGINFREIITEQFDTGISHVDTLVPLGKGQRELLVGDARSGKTDFIVDIIVNQGQTGVICIYAAIGKPIAEVGGFIDILNTNKALDHTIIVATSSTDLAPLIFLTPQTAFTIAEYFQKQGKDVLVILDDLGNHAKIYREISLLSSRPPGRESYPGDIFYQHAHLLERAGNFNKEAGGGSITALPTIEVTLSDFATFIPTNLMSMTDGHLLFKSSLYNQGQRPAIDTSLSVSRVGQQTQNRVQNLLSTRIKQVIAQATQLETLSRFSFELPFETQLILNQRSTIEELLKQPPLTYIGKEEQVVLLALPFTSFLKDKDKEFVRANLQVLLDTLSNDPELAKITESVFNFKDDKELIAALEKVSDKFAVKANKPAEKGFEQQKPARNPSPNNQATTAATQPEPETNENAEKKE